MKIKDKFKSDKMESIKELTIKELDKLGMDYAFEIIMYKRKIKELEAKVELIKSEIDKKIKEDKTVKSNIKAFDSFI